MSIGFMQLLMVANRYANDHPQNYGVQADFERASSILAPSMPRPICTLFVSKFLTKE
jgi:hypothetical protein